MAKRPAKNINWTLGALAIEDEITSIELSIAQELAKVDGFAALGPERVVGNYDWGINGEGIADFAASQGDAIIFGLVSDADGTTSALDPTGASAGASDPNYDGSVVLESYSIKGAVGGAITYSVQLQGSTALTRAVA